MGRKSAVLARAERFPPPEPAGDVSESPEDVEAEAPEDETVDTDAVISDNVGEQSIEINVENLIAELEAESQHGHAPELQCARRKLEDYLERKRIARDLEDFDDFAVED